MSGRSIPSNFVKSVLQNGVGRYVCQLQRITFKFCKSSGSSRGLRDYIQQELLDFTRENPGIVVYLLPKRHQPARAVAEYLNGNSVTQNLSGQKPEDIVKWVEHLRCRSGINIERLRKYQHTDTPSIQGIWTPWTNKDSSLNIADFTKREFLEKESKELSATDKILKLAEELRFKKQKQVVS